MPPFSPDRTIVHVQSTNQGIVLKLPPFGPTGPDYFTDNRVDKQKMFDKRHVSLMTDI